MTQDCLGTSIPVALGDWVGNIYISDRNDEIHDEEDCL